MPLRLVLYSVGELLFSLGGGLFGGHYKSESYKATNLEMKNISRRKRRACSAKAYHSFEPGVIEDILRNLDKQENLKYLNQLKAKYNSNRMKIISVNSDHTEVGFYDCDRKDSYKDISIKKEFIHEQKSMVQVFNFGKDVKECEYRSQVHGDNYFLPLLGKLFNAHKLESELLGKVIMVGGNTMVYRKQKNTLISSYVLADVYFCEEYI